MKMAGEAANKQKKTRNGEGILLSQKWKNYVQKKENTEVKETKKMKDRLRYLLRKEGSRSMCSHEKRELKLLHKILDN